MQDKGHRFDRTTACLPIQPKKKVNLSVNEIWGFCWVRVLTFTVTSGKCASTASATWVTFFKLVTYVDSVQTVRLN